MKQSKAIIQWIVEVVLLLKVRMKQKLW